MDKSFSRKLITILGILGIISILVSWSNKDNYKKTRIKINSKIIIAQVADTESLRIQGLSGRNKLGKNKGMLFVFDNKDYYKFWMKDMKFPLDIIFINDDRIVDIKENLAVPSGNQIPSYRTKEKANYVLEVNAGFCKDNHIRVGDKVDIDSN